ncbi:fungal-specific transcription factor domain-containing protein [Ilyonectria sp. MPI-CAGE-AT-0026]|nr:fungal-specific transcription factor domain-containing protein [Ilyonectria sp. MPI-CAGE-AT-0026]
MLEETTRPADSCCPGPMPRKNKKASCWTCRLRHKKCDALLPVCGGCAALEISCHYVAEKPDWMDSGERQQQMTRRIKVQVKQSAKRRRGIALMESIAQDLTSTSEDAASSSHLDASPSYLDHLTPQNSICTAESSTTVSNNSFDLVGISGRPLAPSGEPIISPDYCSTSVTDNLSTTSRSDLDMGYITGYMDYVFPALFPFYRPSILQGGRTWLLVLATKNTGFFNTIVSLSSYFFCTIPIAPGPAHDACASSTWKELQKQMDLALMTVQRDLKDIGSRGVGKSLLNDVYLLATIAQLLNFEIALPSGKWQIHLDAATNLFEKIIRDHGGDDTARGIHIVLERLGGPGSSLPIPPNPNQGAFRFFATILLIYDIIAGTSLERSPELKIYHRELEQDGPGKVPAVKMEEVIGCETWVLLAIRDIATLGEWKKEQSNNSSWSEADFISRATCIEARLQEGLAQLDDKEIPYERESSQCSQPDQRLEQMLQRSNCAYGFYPLIPELNTHITRIWAHAAHTYLLVLLLGWQPADPRIRSNTTRMIELFDKISSPTWLRSLVWPFCVSGCLALGQDRDAFRRIGNAMEAFQALGTAQEALSIMENVWMKQEVDSTSWDVGACLKSLGHRVLLV